MAWVQACTIEQLKTGPFIFKHERLQIALYRTAHGFYALDNRCPHEGYPLAEGTVDEQGILTCNWHNWKFKMDDGECLLGGDHVRAYQVKQEGDQVLLNLAPLAPEVIQRRIVSGLQVAFEKQEYGRICREISRLHFSKLDPLIAVHESIQWAYDKFEYGTTHAFAACADWLALYLSYAGDWERQLVCLAETVNHMAFDALRHPPYPYFSRSIHWDSDGFCEAVEKETRSIAESMVGTATNSGLPFADLESALTKAALAHYNDFGHSLIYVQKARELIDHLGEQYATQILLPLARHLSYTTREDLIPEFSEYRPKLEKCADSFGTSTSVADLAPLRRGGITAALGWTAEATHQFTPQAIFDALLYICAENLLLFDLNNEKRVNNSVADNVGWLGFTHAITFANAVHQQCERYPEFWQQGLLQIACFVGRNQRFRDLGVKPNDWTIDDSDEFLHRAHEIIFDSGIRAPIFVAHYLKTTVAVQDEINTASPPTQQILLAALNRFLHSPIKQKHSRRLANQAIALVARDYT